MYAVSEQYKAMMKNPVQRFALSGTIGGVEFTQDNILQGSFSITNQCSDGTNVQIGQVYVGELNATFMNMRISRYSWKGKEIIPMFGLYLEDGSIEYIPLGIFTIDSAKHTSSGVVVKAYDNMAKLDKNCGIEAINGKPYDLLVTACNTCGLKPGTFDAQFQAMPNGGKTLSMYTENDIETWRDFVSWLAQTVGGNAFAGRDGRIIIKAYGQEVVDEIDDSHRFMGCEFSDFSTRYTGLSAVNIADKTTTYYNVSPDDGLTYNLGSNPFVQYGVEETIEGFRTAILDALQQIDYVPFSATMIGNPAYDLMDVFRFKDGLADGSKLFCMTKFEFVYNRDYKMEGCGQDPSLASARSKMDKNLAGLMNSSSEQEFIRYYDYINAVPYTLDSSKDAEIINIRYVTVKATHVDFHAEVKLKVNGAAGDHGPGFKTALLTVTYYLNGQKVTDYVPVETMYEGTHLLHLLFTWNSTGGLTGTFAAYLHVDDATVEIERGGIRAYLAGQGLAGDGEWDGSIKAYDDFITIIPTFESVGIVDSALVEVDGGVDIDMYDAVIEHSIEVFEAVGFSDALVLQTGMRWTPAETDMYSVSDEVVIEGDHFTGHGLVTTNNYDVDQVVKVHTISTGDTVIFDFSFDGGDTWCGCVNGDWVEDSTNSEEELAVIPRYAWDGITQIMVRAHLIRSSNLYEINVFTEDRQ